MPNNLCESTAHQEGSDTRAKVGLRLCRACHDRLKAGLAGLPDLYAGCEQALTGSRYQLIEWVSGWRPSGIVLDDAAVTVRADMVAVLASWAGLIASERGVPAPRQQREIGRLVAFLTEHLDWLSAHLAAGDFAGEVADLTRAAQNVISPDTAMYVKLGPCEQPGCGKPVFVRIGAADQALPDQVSCEAGHGVPPERWLLRSRELARFRREFDQWTSQAERAA
jgi:hypothetical protein